MFLELLYSFNTEIVPLVYKILFIISPVVVPAVLIYIFVILWVRHVQLKYVSELKSFMYEIKIPKDIQKSPLAMEIVLTSMQASGAATYTEAYLQGKVKGWFSLELVSFGGDIHFYIWSSEPKFKPILEAQIYAQYPTVEVHLVPPEEDYTRKFIYDSRKNSVWGTQFKLIKSDVYPIKTYVDYGLDKDQKDEYKIDPMTALLEYLGSAKPGTQLWYQILIKMHSKEDLKNHRLFEKGTWIKEADKEIDKIRAEATPDTGGDYPGFPNPTKGQLDIIAAIDRSKSKLCFETMIRSFYVSDKFDSTYVSGMLGSMRQFNSNTLNGLKNSKWTDTTDAFKDWCTIFPFMKKTRDDFQEKYRKEMFEAYKMRSFFYPPYQYYRQQPFIMTTEELATIYHFPGNVSATPTLSKIPSKKSEAPPNLPIRK